MPSRSPPKSLLQAPTSAPKSDYTNRLGLAAALRKKLGSGPLSGHLSRGPRSSRGPHSGLRSEAIAEEQADAHSTDKGPSAIVDVPPVNGEAANGHAP